MAGPLVLAHRGANRVAPENTLPAFAAALEQGADGVELDVHRTVDRRLVVHHDAAAPPLGVLAGLTLEAIRAGRPEIPTLEEALDVCAGFLVNVEVKNLPGDADYDPADEAAELLVELLAGRDHRDDVLVSSFNLPTIDRVRALDASVPTALLTYTSFDPIVAVGVARDRGHVAIHPAVQAMAGDVAAAVVDAAHRAGLRVNVWTVDDVDELQRLAGAGVDGLVTDVPDLAVRVLRG